MMLSAAMLPKMELDIGIMRLKVDDNGIFCGVRFPEKAAVYSCLPHDKHIPADRNDSL